MNIDP